MIPRVFISSTFYDLKHVRERLESFLNQYGFEPVLFERDKVTYQHGIDIDKSAYQEVTKCHVMVLIIGGRYGTISSPETKQNEDRKKEEEFHSITQKEYITANSTGIPIFVFIERNVYSEYQTYKKNESLFKGILAESKVNKNTENLKFAYVDNANIFQFIDSVIGQPVKTFDRIDEIEHYLKNQFSGWFLMYLESLKVTNQDSKVLDSVKSLNKVVEVMNEMIDAMGKKVLNTDSDELKQVNEKQFDIIAGYFSEQVSNYMTFANELPIEELNKIDVSQLVKAFFKIVLNADKIQFPKDMERRERLRVRNQYQSKLISEFNEYLRSVNPNIEMDHCKVMKLQSELETKVKPFIRDESHLTKLIELIRDDWTWKLEKMPEA
jgi:hypothetical protein